MKTCVIVDAYSSGRLLAPAFKNEGYEVILALSSNHLLPGYIPYNPSYQKEDFFLVLDPATPEEHAEKLREYKPEFVIPGAEMGVEHAERLGALLKLPGNNADESEARRDKFKMIEKLKSAGLATPAQILATNADDALRFANTLTEFRVILKPTRSAGTHQVFEAKNEQELRTVFDQILNAVNTFGEVNTHVLVQEFIEGVEFAVDTVSCDGVHIVTDIVRYALTNVNGKSFFYDYVEIIPADAAEAAELTKFTKESLTALGIQWGAAHTEIFLTKQGPVAIEIGARLAGAFLPAVVRDIAGRGQVEYVVDAYTKPEAFIQAALRPYTLSKYAALVILTSPVIGTLKALHAFDRVEQLSSYKKTLAISAIGSVIEKTVDLDTSPGKLMFANRDRNQLIADIAQFRKIEQDLYQV